MGSKQNTGNTQIHRTIKWTFLSCQHMIIHLEMQRVYDLNLIDKDGTWINGYDQMKKDQTDFPTKSVKNQK